MFVDPKQHPLSSGLNDRDNCLDDKILADLRKMEIAQAEKEKAAILAQVGIPSPRNMNRREILDIASKIVSQDRSANYGGPEESFGRIAQMWSAYAGVPFSAADVAAMMVLLKVARISNNPMHADNWVDIAGYAACGGEIATPKNQPG